MPCLLLDQIQHSVRTTIGQAFELGEVGDWPSFYWVHTGMQSMSVFCTGKFSRDHSTLVCVGGSTDGEVHRIGIRGMIIESKSKEQLVM